jgi:membrane-associated protease RseP (regulator of RpoE activity)
VRSGQKLIIFEGTLKMEAKDAYAVLSERFGRTDYVPFLYQEEDGKTYIRAIHRSVAGRAVGIARPLINLILLLATVVTTTAMGALFQGVDLIKEPLRIAEGFPYSLSLLAILGTHELGHYFMARYHGIQVTLPFFIPVPFALGTFGAFIQMRSFAKDKSALFDVGIAGPLAGLFVAIPALIFGIQRSQIIAGHVPSDGMAIPQSILLDLIEKVALGRITGENATIILHPIAFAGWLGLMITALNLIPIGQLDGGHISYALFGKRKSQIIAFVAFAALLLLGIFYWQPWLTWAIVIFFLSGFRHVPTLNDITSLDTKRLLLGGLAFLLLFLIMAPPLNLGIRN